MFLIPKYVKTIMERLNANGYEAYLAGGCVRDFLMEKTPSDYDMTTSATPNETKECFKDFSVIETGIAHGTVTVVTKDGNVEITTYRIDGDYKDNRHPENVLFSRNLKDDLKRRDFTVNAMAYNEKDGLVDLYDGKEHIKDRIISCVGEADKRFSEDALRILRALRFASVLGFEIEEKTARSIIKNKDLLKNISKERIFTEFKKLLLGKAAGKILLNYKSVIDVFITGFNNAPDSLVSDIGKYEENLRLSYILSYLTPDGAVAVLKNLKCDNKTISFVRDVIKGVKTDLSEDEVEIKEFLRDCSYEILMAVLKIQNKEKVLKKAEKIIKNNECYSIAQLDLNGNDIKSLGLSGSNIKNALNKALLGVIKGEVINKKSELIKYITYLLKKY